MALDMNFCNDVKSLSPTQSLLPAHITFPLPFRSYTYKTIRREVLHKSKQRPLNICKDLEKELRPLRKYFCVEIKFQGRHLNTPSLKISWRSKEPELLFHISCSATWCGREGSTQHTATRKQVVGMGIVSSKVCTVDH